MSEDGDGGSSAIDDGGDSSSYASDDGGVESSVDSSDDAGSSAASWSDDGGDSGYEGDTGYESDAGDETAPAYGSDTVDDGADGGTADTLPAATTDGELAGIESDAELGALPGAATDGTLVGGGVVAADGTLLAEGAVAAGGAVAATPGAVTTAFGTVGVDPSTVVGRPDLDQAYFAYQGTRNANCGPYSAASVLNSIMGGNGPTGEELAQYAKDRGWLEQDLVNGNPDWGYWTGLDEFELTQLMDDYLASSGGDAVRTRGELTDLEGHLEAGHPVVVAVDSGEMIDGATGDPSDERNPNHFLQVTGIDRTHGLVYLNDPGKTAPSVVPLSQFEAAWKDSGNLMVDARAGAAAPAPLSGDTLAPTAETAAPLVSVPSTPPGTEGPTAGPASGLLADPSLAAVPGTPVPPQPTGCCMLPFTLGLTPAGPPGAAGVAPPAPVDPLAAPGQSVAPSQPGFSAPASDFGTPLVPLPAGLAPPVR